MVEIYSTEQAREWDDIIESFKEYDVYYLSGYVKAFEIHGDGVPHMLYYEWNGLRAVYVYMKRKTSIAGVYDSITPYGYGGVLFEGAVSEENKQHFWRVYVEKMREACIVDNFVRYHPVLANATAMKSISQVVDLGKTIAMDLSSSEVIWKNLSSKHRNMIRKAEKNGVEIRHAHDWELFGDFVKIYNSTMEKDRAEAYYYFEEEFYKSIHRDLAGHYEMFYAVYEGQIIAMSIILFANKQMHYHLSGSKIAYRHLAPSNLLLYKAAQWGCEQGFKTFHLGGGVGSGEDNLYKFKAGFNRCSDYRFSIGKEIFDLERYDELVELKSQETIGFDRESEFFPLYRS